jgi:L-fuconolactonase
MATPERQEAFEERALDPERLIVDPHHHLWDHGKVLGLATDAKPFLLNEMLGAIDLSGHRITHTVYVECHSMYRKDGPSEMRPIGETEFANGMAAMSASGRYGERLIAAGIVGNADLSMGDRVIPVLEAHLRAAGSRFRGIRTHTAYIDGELFGRPADPALKGLMLDARFRTGVTALRRFDLSLDIWCFHSQLDELADLAAHCPDVVMVLNHLGTPLPCDADGRRDAATIAHWRDGITTLARRPNVCVKLGGLGMKFTGEIGGTPGNAGSSQLSLEWRPYVETVIEAFGPERCMFESNFPTDTACSYGALWNTFKRIATCYSESEKSRLFCDTAREVYRLF